MKLEIYDKIICFAKGTSILLHEGEEKAIEEITVGEFVCSYNVSNGTTIAARVEEIAESRHSIAAMIKFDNGKNIVCTLDHPIWTVDRGWCSIDPFSSRKVCKINIGELRVGDFCLSISRNRVLRTAISEIRHIEGDFVMHVISGGEHNCFFANGILSHDENLANLLITDNKRLQATAQSAARFARNLDTLGGT